MDGVASKVRILLIRPWTRPLAPVVSALVQTGFDVRVTRVDIEPALQAALSRGRFDLVLLDPATPELPLDLVAARLREHHSLAPIVTLTTLDELTSTVNRLLTSRLN